MKNVNNANSPTTNSTPVRKQNTDEDKDKDYEVIRVAELLNMEGEKNKVNTDLDEIYN